MWSKGKLVREYIYLYIQSVKVSYCLVIIKFIRTKKDMSGKQKIYYGFVQ